MKKLLAVLVVAGMLALALSGLGFAAGDEEEAPPPLPHYLSVTGTIVSIEEDASEEGQFRVKIEDEDEAPTILIINERTAYPFESECAEGDVVTAYYLSSAPMPLIYPPMFNIAILVAGIPDDCNIKADRFTTWEDREGGYMISGDQQFAFQTDDETEIILADGQDFSDGDIEGRRLVVIYDVSTRSIPELATAVKVIVLFEDIMPLPETVPEVVEVPRVVAEMPILVDGEQVDAPAAFESDDGTVMVPLRALTEALGYELEWNAAAKAVTLDETITLAIGRAFYEIDGEDDVEIDGAPAPLLKDNLTYVPLAFFEVVLDLPFAGVTEGGIEIKSEVEDEDEAEADEGEDSGDEEEEEEED